MTEFKASTKAEAARQLLIIKKDILEQAQKLNSRKIIPLLLCLEDAINNLEVSILKSEEVEKKPIHPMINLALNNLIFEMYGITDEMISLILRNGFYDSSTKIELTEIQLVVFFGTKFEQAQEIKEALGVLRSQGRIGQKPVALGESRNFFSKIPGLFVI